MQLEKLPARHPALHHQVCLIAKLIGASTTLIQRINRPHLTPLDLPVLQVMRRSLDRCFVTDEMVSQPLPIYALLAIDRTLSWALGPVYTDNPALDMPCLAQLHSILQVMTTHVSARYALCCSFFCIYALCSSFFLNLPLLPCI